MINSEKIQILKDNIFNYINNSKITDEIIIFNFAKQQTKEMRIEITKGEIKSIIYDILSFISFNSNNELNDFSQNKRQDLIEKEESLPFDYISDF